MNEWLISSLFRQEDLCVWERCVWIEQPDGRCERTFVTLSRIPRIRSTVVDWFLLLLNLFFNFFFFFFRRMRWLIRLAKLRAILANSYYRQSSQKKNWLFFATFEMYLYRNRYYFQGKYRGVGSPHTISGRGSLIVYYIEVQNWLIWLIWIFNN